MKKSANIDQTAEMSLALELGVTRLDLDTLWKRKSGGSQREGEEARKNW